jgi:AhpD family alkylhydroperoxidase
MPLILPGPTRATRHEYWHPSGLAEATALLVQLRASQTNGWGLCVDLHSRELKPAGETDERVFAGCGLAGVAVLHRRRARRVGDRRGRDPPQRPTRPGRGVWDEAACHYGETALSSLIIEIAAINV